MDEQETTNGWAYELGPEAKWRYESIREQDGSHHVWGAVTWEDTIIDIEGDGEPVEFIVWATAPSLEQAAAQVKRNFDEGRIGIPFLDLDPDEAESWARRWKEKRDAQRQG